MHNGTVIPKPDTKADFVVKGWGKRRGEKALIYFISNHNKPNKPYQKGITESEWLKAYQQIMNIGIFGREWFNNNMQSCNGVLKSWEVSANGFSATYFLLIRKS